MNRLFTVFALLCACAAASAEERRAWLRGYVYDLESGRYLYSELHEARMRGDDWLGGKVRFFGPDGQEFGHKTLDFTRDRFVPVYKLVLRDRYVDGISDNGPRIAMLRQMPGGPLRTETAERKGLVAADSGLPRLISEHLDSLDKGNALEFRVAAPTRLATYRFEGYRVADETFEGRKAVVIRLNMDSMLKLFAGPIFLAFEPGTRRLLEFRGASNIHPDADGEIHKVRVSYYTAPPKDATGVPPLPK